MTFFFFKLKFPLLIGENYIYVKLDKKWPYLGQFKVGYHMIHLQKVAQRAIF